ncbi:MAG: hypothetical protein ACLSAP_08530 [Oscillospiraceae bacterium]
MQRILAVFVILSLCLLSGCAVDRVAAEYIAYYNGEIYDKIVNWYPIGDVDQEDKAWVGQEGDLSKTESIEMNSKIVLYKNDPNSLFLTYKSTFSEDATYHKG